MATATKIQKEIFAQIEKFDTIIIHRHQRPDPDAIGSQMGLTKVLRHAFPNKMIYPVGSSAGNLSWLGESVEIPDSTYQDALVIVLDTANPPRVDDERYTTGKELIKIDHHPNDDPYGDLMWVDDDASSTSELLVDFATNLNLTITPEAATDFYAGIVGDTGRFMYPATSAHTFEDAAILKRTGFDAAEVTQRLGQISLAQARLQGYLFEHLAIDTTGAASLIVTSEELKKLGLPVDEASSIVSTPGRLAEVVAWLIFVEQPDGTYRAHYRSKGPEINQLAKQHDGGGHALASGANAKNEAEIQTMISELQDAVMNYQASRK